MKCNKRLISMILSMCVLVALMLQSAHTYTHLVSEYLEGSSHTHHDKVAKHHTDDCQICHFALSPFTPVTSEVIVFNAFLTHSQTNVAYQLSFDNLSFHYISVRGPPVLV